MLTPCPDNLREYSVVFNDRSLNHMSKTFQCIMGEISETLKGLYQAKALAIVPGGGTYGMEAIARQFALNKHCLVLRHGWFSFRWTEILDRGNIAKSHSVLKAKVTRDTPFAPFSPPALEETIQAILTERPEVVFVPHVETSSGLILPDDYLKALGKAVHEVGGLLVLDCVASGAIWIEMESLGIDVLLSAPQKGWTASPGAAFVLMSQRALDKLALSQSNSFALDLSRWLSIMQAYEGGQHAYHATMPTDTLAIFHKAMKETSAMGFAEAKSRQWQLGVGTRKILCDLGYASVAASGYEAPGVVVSYTDQDSIHNTLSLKALGMQIAAGVPLRCDEPSWFKTFRLGLFGLDKLLDVEGTLDYIAATFGRL